MIKKPELGEMTFLFATLSMPWTVSAVKIGLVIELNSFVKKRHYAVSP